VLFLQEQILIPESRIGVLIGKQGITRKKIERETRTRLDIDSAIGEVIVNGSEKNAIGFYNALNIIKAIGRGFSPKNAFLLLKEGFILEVLRIPDYVGDNESLLKAKRGRIIGRDGKAREKIEKKFKTKISVLGKTVSIIGESKGIEKSKRAIEMLLGGAKHATALGSPGRGELKKFEI